jgi:predicted RNA polymerase sigma factor
VTSIEAVFREEWPRLVASLVRHFGDLDVAEEAAVDRLPLAHYHPWHAVRAELLARLGRAEESRAAYDRAIELTANPAEQALLRRRRARG